MIESFKRVLEVCPEIVYIGDPILRQKTEESSWDDGVQASHKLVDVLQKYRAVTGVGRGLAAPQIGINQCVFVIFFNNEFQTFINPRIVRHSESKNLFIESCLSSGCISVDVKRYESVTVEYTNEKAEIKVTTADGFLARLLQHEIDHLEGILNIDIGEKKTLHFMVDDPLKQTLRKV